ncbi:MAG: hypothetical protein FJ276_01535 [Planctomycetes bacterium]|nr:hypothetical protein [Planctomycetota bacterium]
MRRHLLGIISLLLLAAAAYGLMRFGTKESHAEFLSSVCLRGGLVLGAIWLALPQLIRLFKSTSPWFVGLLGAASAVIVLRPRTIVVLGPAILLLAVLHFFGWLIRPLPDRSSRGNPRDSHSRRDDEP